MKKYLVYVPLVGLYLGCTHEDWLKSLSSFHWNLSAMVQSVSIGIAVILAIYYML